MVNDYHDGRMVSKINLSPFCPFCLFAFLLLFVFYFLLFTFENFYLVHGVAKSCW